MVPWIIICSSFFLNSFSSFHLNGCKCWGNCSESVCISWQQQAQSRTQIIEFSKRLEGDAEVFLVSKRAEAPTLSRGDPQEERGNHLPLPSKSPKMSCLKENGRLPWGRFWWHQRPARWHRWGLTVRAGPARAEADLAETCAPAMYGDALGRSCLLALRQP